MNNPTIILVRPQLPENIGMASRAMLNFGFTDLRLVAPRDEFPSVEAISASSGASDIIFPGVKVVDSMAEGIKDFHYLVATSARSREQAIDVLPPAQSLAMIEENLARGAKVGVMFGPERTGLTNSDIVHANHILAFPTNPDFPSLNLAGSVLLFCYSWFQRRLGQGQVARPARHDRALVADRDHFIQRLLVALTESDFFKSPPMKPALSRNIAQMITRANFSEQEIRTLQGILTSLTQKK